MAFSLYNLWLIRSSNIDLLNSKSWKGIHSLDGSVDAQQELAVDTKSNIDKVEEKAQKVNGKNPEPQKELKSEEKAPLKTPIGKTSKPEDQPKQKPQKGNNVEDRVKEKPQDLVKSSTPESVLEYDPDEDYSGIRQPKYTEKLPNYPQDIPYPNRKTFDTFNFRLYSHNVHESLENVNLEGELPWAQRVHMLASSINFNSRENSVVMLQEVKKDQLDDILRRLNQYEGGVHDEWDFYGAPMIDGKIEGRNVPILFKKSEWEVIYSHTHELNKEASKGDIYSRSIVVCVVTLMNIKTGNFINIFNTQLDARSKESRVNSIKTIISLFHSINQEWPTFIIGDLNFEYGAKPYKALEKNFVNIDTLKSDLTNFGHSKSTLTGFEGEEIANGGTDIDYIWALSTIKELESKKECNAEDYFDFRLHGFALLHSKYMGQYMSDHRPLVGDFALRRCDLDI